MTSEPQEALKSEIMLQINEHLYLRGLISREVYEQAKVRIVRAGAVKYTGETIRAKERVCDGHIT